MRLFFLSLFLLPLFVSADPLIIKGANGSWLPVIAREWQEDNGGVFLTFSAKKECRTIRETLMETFPEMDVEQHGNRLFFPNASLYTLFNKLLHVDFPVKASVSDPLALLHDSWNKPLVKKRNGEHVSPEMITARILSVTVDDTGTALHLTVAVTKRAKEGVWKSLRGIQKVSAVFVVKNGVADIHSPHNKAIGDLIFAKKGDSIAFLPEGTAKRTDGKPQELARCVIVSQKK